MAPNHSARAENTIPRGSPPGPSAIQPTTVGPTIWPNANTMVKALMPLPQAAGSKLCRTNAVVDATKDRNTAPNSSPDAKITAQWALKVGNSVAKPEGVGSFV